MYIVYVYIHIYMDMYLIHISIYGCIYPYLDMDISRYILYLCTFFTTWHNAKKMPEPGQI